MCPPTAQYALRQAKHVAKMFLATIKGARVRPFSHRNLGVFVPLGMSTGAAEVMGLKVSGMPAWWLYRTYYLFQLPRLERKIRVLIDWNLALLFRRDIVQQDVTRIAGLLRAHYEPGQMVFQQSELAAGFYVILAGRVQVFRQEGEQEIPIATLGPGEYFGEMALLRDQRHTASVRALTAVDLLTMSGTDFTTLARSSTHFSELLAGVMKQRLADNEANRSQD